VAPERRRPKNLTEKESRRKKKYEKLKSSMLRDYKVQHISSE
jgi:hypothetical protein